MLKYPYPSEQANTAALIMLPTSDWKDEIYTQRWSDLVKREYLRQIRFRCLRYLYGGTLVSRPYIMLTNASLDLVTSYSYKLLSKLATCPFGDDADVDLRCF
jgi:hypothetical protein